MRGKETFGNCRNSCTRITPAYAGKSAAFRPKIPVPQDHPRLCGEKLSFTAVTTDAVGSPPPMRGKGVCFRCQLLQIRITPAYAGKSECIGNQYLYFKDHPRLCGEKHISYYLESKNEGSPPPMRGKAFLVCQCDYSTGITPAYAGKSGGCQHKLKMNEDHPRLCGEKFEPLQKGYTMTGSPPPMRGKGIL